MARGRRWRKVGRWALRLVGVALVGAIGAGLYVYDYPRVAADLPDAALAYRDAGLPWTAKDLTPNPPVKPEENAAPLLRAAIAAMPRDKIALALDTDWRDDADLATYAKALSIVHEAARCSRLDWGRDWDLGEDLQFEEEPFVRRLVKALVARAMRRVRTRDDAGTLADLEDARRLSVLTGQEPAALGGWMAESEEAIVLEASEACLAIAASDAARLSLYRDWIARPVPMVDLHQTLRGEVYRNVADARNLERNGIGTFWNPLTYGTAPHDDQVDEGPRIDPTRIRRDGLPDRQRPRAYMARCLRRWTELANATHGLTDSTESIALATLPIEERIESEGFTMSDYYDSYLFSSYSHFTNRNRIVMSNRVVALAYADALIHHARTGAWPTSCPVPDPLGEGTLRVRVSGGRFRAWSVGRNGLDDGGLTPTERSDLGKSGDDLVAAYPPIPRRVQKRTATRG